VKLILKLALAFVALVGMAIPVWAQAPHLEQREGVTQLIVDGEPLLIRGGELGNSSASHREYLAPAWQRFQAMHMNTVLAPVSWELIEPDEGKFDFSTIDWLLEDARTHDMKLVLLWFGTWKNSMSTYVPPWVKRDSDRFPRTIGEGGKPQEILSALSPEVRDADARAFAALMRHLKKVDSEDHTVIMVQIENEVGFLPFAKEGALSGDAWADEREQAVAYARFIDAVAAAGKAEYDLPMFANAAQGRPGVPPGGYPSGGPLAHLADIWREEAPHLDFIAPDIYFPSFAEITDGYVASGNPLFIPEANRAGDPRAGANALRAIGKHSALGFSPFAIDTISKEGQEQLASLYGMLEQLEPMMHATQPNGWVFGISNPVSFDDEADLSPIEVSVAGFTFTATTIDPWTARDDQDPTTHGALLIWLPGDNVIVAGQGVTFTVADEGGEGQVGLETVEEGRVENGKWVTTRRLNGDQTHQGRHVRLPPGDYTIQKIRLYRY
jgi:beta-galactosidase GanA